MPHHGERYIVLHHHKDTGYRAYQVILPVPPEHPKAPRWSKTFNINRWGDKALQLARTWRDTTGPQVWGDAMWEVVLEDAGTFAANRVPFSASGRVGVCLIEHKGYQNWRAKWHETGPDGKRRMRERSFAVRKYGFDKAREMAIAARDAGVIQDFRNREVY